MVNYMEAQQKRARSNYEYEQSSPDKLFERVDEIVCSIRFPCPQTAKQKMDVIKYQNVIIQMGPTQLKHIFPSISNVHTCKIRRKADRVNKMKLQGCELTKTRLCHLTHQSVPLKKSITLSIKTMQQVLLIEIIHIISHSY